MNDMRQISRYAYPNTRIRAMLSGLLEKDFFTGVSNIDFLSFLDALGKTEYSEAIKNRETITPEEFEISCTDSDREKIRRISSFFLSKNEKRIIFLLDERYTIESLKYALRLWKKKQRPFHSGLIGDFSSILEVKTIDEVIEILKDSDYASAIEIAKKEFEKTGSLYPVEISIDKKYFKKLQEAIEQLTSSDRIIAKNILGAQIDRENLLWLGRILLYYKEKIPDKISGFIPGGMLLSEKDLERLLRKEIGSVNELRIPLRYAGIIEKLPERLSEIDSILEETIIHQIKKALVEKPFTIGIPLGYIFLKQQETKRIIRLFVSKYFSRH